MDLDKKEYLVIYDEDQLTVCRSRQKNKKQRYSVTVRYPGGKTDLPGNFVNPRTEVSRKLLKMGVDPSALINSRVKGSACCSWAWAKIGDVAKRLVVDSDEKSVGIREYNPRPPP